MLARVAFYPTLLYNVVMERVSSRQWFTRIDDAVVLGALPFRSMTDQLYKDENIRGVVTLNEEYETRFFVNSADEWQQSGIEQLRLDTADLTAAPTQDKLSAGVQFILRYKNEGSSVYVHCKAGRTRSATLVACYLMQIHQWDPEKAVSEIQTKRPHILLRNTQWEALRTFYDDNIIDR